MSYAKLAHLIRALHQQTNSGKIEWKSTAEDGTFQVSFPNYSVLLSTRPSVRGQGDDVIVAVLNSEGRMLEQATDVDFDADTLPNAYATMKQLYEVARRQSLGVEQALDALLIELGEDPENDIPF